jgi:hypothetical protein
MSAEPPGCLFSSCNTACPAGTTATYSVKCSGGATGMQSRCCPGDSYPDVLLLVDRGTGQPTTYLSGNVPNADYSYLRNEWTTAKELLALPGESLYAKRYSVRVCCSSGSAGSSNNSNCSLCKQRSCCLSYTTCASICEHVPKHFQLNNSIYLSVCAHVCRGLHVSPGGQWQQLKDYGELDMADPSTLAGFLQRGLARCAFKWPVHPRQQLQHISNKQHVAHVWNTCTCNTFHCCACRPGFAKTISNGLCHMM